MPIQLYLKQKIQHLGVKPKKEKRVASTMLKKLKFSIIYYYRNISKYASSLLRKWVLVVSIYIHYRHTRKHGKKWNMVGKLS